MSYPLALNIDNPATKGYLFYSSLLIGKTLLMSTFTARHRFQKLVIIISYTVLLLIIITFCMFLKPNFFYFMQNSLHFSGFSEISI